jgi:hypothetical protein
MQITAPAVLFTLTHEKSPLGDRANYHRCAGPLRESLIDPVLKGIDDAGTEGRQIALLQCRDQTRRLP